MNITLLRLFIVVAFNCICSFALSQHNFHSQSDSKKIPKIKKYDFFIGWERELFFEIYQAQEFEKEYLEDLKLVSKNYTQAQKKVVFWAKFNDQCCTEERRNIARLLLPEKDLLIETYKDFGYPERDLEELEKYFESIKKTEPRSDIILWGNIYKFDSIDIKKQRFVLENLDSLVKDKIGEPINLKYSGWVSDTLLKRKNLKKDKGIYRAKLSDGIIQIEYCYDSNGVLKKINHKIPEEYSLTYSSTGKIERIDSLIKRTPEYCDWETKVFYPNGRLFQKWVYSEYFVQFVGSMEDEHRETFFPNGQIALKPHKYNELIPECWDSNGVKILENGRGVYNSWELIKGKLSLKKTGKYAHSKRIGVWHTYEMGQLILEHDYGSANKE